MFFNIPPHSERIQVARDDPIHLLLNTSLYFWLHLPFTHGSSGPTQNMSSAVQIAAYQNLFTRFILWFDLF